MTLFQQLHHSAAHKPGLDAACPVCNPDGWNNGKPNTAIVGKSYVPAITCDWDRVTGQLILSDETAVIRRAIRPAFVRVKARRMFGMLNLTVWICGKCAFKAAVIDLGRWL